MSLAEALAKLNPSQREVVECREHCVAVAVPGAGKTATIAAKAALLLSDPIKTVGAVTFSKDAAIELRDRILALAGPSAKKRLIAGTFHSLAYKQLSFAANKRPDIATEGERAAIVLQLLQEMALEWKLEDAVSAIERCKTQLSNPSADTVEGRLYAGYQQALERNGRLDFQDLMRHAVLGMRDGTIKPFAVDALLVDEFQDSDHLQTEWTSIHARAGAATVVVADDDQTIFCFRSALGKTGIDAFVREFEARQIVLGINYRSHSEILSVAGKVIRNNRDRIVKELTAFKGPGGEVRFLRHDDEYKEAVAAVEAMATGIRAGESAAILARTNRILDPVEAVCRSQGVKYHRAAGRSILDRPESALFGNLLELVEHAGTAGLDSVLGFAGIGMVDLQVIQGINAPSMIPLRLTKKELLSAGLGEDAAIKYFDLNKRLTEWRSLCARTFHALVLDGVHEWMLKWASSDQGKRSINTTYDVLSRLHGQFSDRLDFLRRKNNEAAADAIVLTTFHSSKGLEWDRTALIRLEESVIPDDGSTETEERRLFYVAATRARRIMILSTARKNPTSRFLIEAGLA
ncbi:ATP-dependent helicase [Cupriavidus agavae]|uniref:DNA 3'-5' helicase n=1 Tax=Cupriavidus agavae TaxID=1001822 RepID=A0A4V2FG38_9BURK|nr:ATP-dependent helicase [Cupriavidus agavae]RZT35429.1 superfamily I DNA/RNA helicase [Cupriavidus agavae]